MTTTEWITLASLLLALLTTVANLIATFYTNRENNRAKLAELTFAKQLEVLNEVSVALHETVEVYQTVYMDMYKEVNEGLNPSQEKLASPIPKEHTDRIIAAWEKFEKVHKLHRI